MMMKKRLFYLSQLLWQALFFLANTIWKDIPKIPIWASRNDILDEMRWLWLMDAPKSAIAYSCLVANVVYSLSIVEFTVCLAYIVVYAKRNWERTTVVWKATQSAIILCGTAVSLFFEMTKYHQFVNMTDYYFLRYSIVTPEIFSIIVIILGISYTVSRRKRYKCQFQPHI